jgi:hypothetical protein
MTTRRILIIIASAVLTSLVGYAGKAMWENYQHNGSILKFEPPQQSGITPNVQLPTSSTEVFIAQSTGFDHLEAFDCAANSRESYRGMIERMNLWLKSNPQYQGMGFSAVPDNRGNYLKFVLVCKRTGVVNMEKVRKKN